MTDLDAIYTAPDGTKHDPLALYRKLLVGSGNRINDLLTDWQSEGDPLKAASAEESLVGIARTAFGLKPFGAEGPTDRRVLDTLEHFLEFTAKKE